MASLFDSIKSYSVKPSKRKGVTVDEQVYYIKKVEGLNPTFGYGSVLEIGCGNCLLPISLSHLRGVEAVGIDEWTEFPTREEANHYVKMFRADVTLVEALNPLPFRDSSFDTVFAFLIFYAMKREKRREVVEEAKRVLKPNGRFVLVDIERGVKKDVNMKEVYSSSDQGVYITVFTNEKQ